MLWVMKRRNLSGDRNTSQSHEYFPHAENLELLFGVGGIC